MNAFPFYELRPGSNVLRCMTNPHQYVCHPNFILTGGTLHKQKLKCANHDGRSACVICDSGSKAGCRWIIAVWSNFHENLFCLDFGFEIYRSIRALATDRMWGDPQIYDLNISTQYEYGFIVKDDINIIPYPKTDLTDKQLEIKSHIDVAELKRLTDPPSNEYLEKILAQERLESQYLMG